MFLCGFYTCYALAGVYVWSLGLPWAKKYLALLTMLILWPVFIMDIDYKHDRNGFTR